MARHGHSPVSIYATELIKDYGVKNIMRVGSCGALGTSIQLGDIFIAMGASTDSKCNRMRLMDHDFAAAIADYLLLSTAVSVAQNKGKKVHVGNVFSADLLHTAAGAVRQTGKMNVLAVEMESAGLYGLAAEYGARALDTAHRLRPGRTHQHLVRKRGKPVSAA